MHLLLLLLRSACLHLHCRVFQLRAQCLTELQLLQCAAHLRLILGNLPCQQVQQVCMQGSTLLRACSCNLLCAHKLSTALLKLLGAVSRLLIGYHRCCSCGRRLLHLCHLHFQKLQLLLHCRQLLLCDSQLLLCDSQLLLCGSQPLLCLLHLLRRGCCYCRLLVLQLRTESRPCLSTRHCAFIPLQPFRARLQGCKLLACSCQSLLSSLGSCCCCSHCLRICALRALKSSSQRSCLLRQGLCIRCCALLCAQLGFEAGDLGLEVGGVGLVTRSGSAQVSDLATQRLRLSCQSL
mmetsp:Transcript_13289/g.35590  ORF Transcript_13289/g.35590 Transcript_13289/m.35590 type:complete len:293 (+) Transcript_13289:156-1034(+)